MYANAYNSSQPARKASGCKICLISLTWPYLSLVGFTGPYWALQCLIGRYLALEGLIEPSFQYGRKGKKRGPNGEHVAVSRCRETDWLCMFLAGSS